jgi:hypothetical protein
MAIKPVPAILAIALALWPACEAQARDPLVQEPSSAWQMDYGEDNCTLIRSFGEGKATTIFAMAMYAPDDSPAIKVMRDENLQRRGSYRVQFAPDADFTEIEYPVRANFGETFEGVILSLSLRPFEEIKKTRKLAQEATHGYFEEPDWDEAERDAREKAITEFWIKDLFRDELHLKLGSMHQPMEAMRACLDELVGHWGIDAEVQRTLSRAPMPVNSPGEWVQPTDYPIGMLHSGYQGVVHFRLIIDAEGKPTKCIVQEASNPDDFGDVSCKALMRKAKFIPALDAAGNPVTSYWSNSVRFVLP